MDDDAPVQPKRRGCLKWTCGGCSVMIFLGIMGTFLLWHFLNRRETGISALENLPPSTMAAVEIHDVHSILEQAGKDKGLAASANIFLEAVPGLPASLEGLSDLGALFPYILPASVVVGINRDGEPFLIARPPAWLRWLIWSGEAGRIESLDADEAHYSFIDGWLVVAPERAGVSEILAHWNARAMPLGPAKKLTAPFVAAAMRTAAAPPPGTAATPQPMMLGNPFAADPAAAPADNLAVTAILTPGNGTWRIVGDAGLVAAGDADEFFKGAGEGTPAVPNPPEAPNADLEVRLVLSPDLTDECRNRLKSWNWPLAAAAPGGAWLDEAVGDVMMIAKKPAVKPDPDLPPAPVVAVGWRLADAVDGTALVDDFAASAHAMVDALRRHDSKPARAVGESLVFRPLAHDGGAGEFLEVPPVILNYARPAWLFSAADRTPALWLATDPDGLAGLPDFDGAVAAPAGKSFAGSARWDVSEDFRLSLFELLRDRLENVPEGSGVDKSKILEAVSGIEGFLALYPRGAFDCDGDWEAGRMSFAASIPFGGE